MNLVGPRGFGLAFRWVWSVADEVLLRTDLIYSPTHSLTHSQLMICTNVWREGGRREEGGGKREGGKEDEMRRKEAVSGYKN